MLRSLIFLLLGFGSIFSKPLFILTDKELSPTEANQSFLGGVGAVLENNAVNAGYTHKKIWIKILPIHIPADKKIIELNYPLLDKVALHIFGDGQLLSKRSGDFIPYERWPVDHKNPSFSLFDEIGSVDFYLLEVASSSSLQVGINTYSIAEFNKKNRIEQIFSGIFYGTFLIMIIYNLFIWFFVREKSYLYYVIFLLSFAFMVLTFQGYAFQNFWPSSIKWNSNAILFFLFLSLWAALSFQRHLLGLKEKLPGYDKAGQYLRTFLLFGVALTIFSNAYFVVVFGFILILLTVAHLLSSSVILIMRKDRSARFYFVAWCFLILGSLINTAVAFDWLPPSFVFRNAMLIGSVFEVALLSFTLGDRYQQILIEKEIAQEELLETRKRSIERQRKQLRSFFRFVPQDFISLLNKRRFESVELGDAMEVNNMTILFADIRGFTDFSEKNKSQDVLNMLNILLSQIEPIILKYGGFIDKYIGDAIMALFPREPVGALKAAHEINQKVKDLNESGTTSFKIGIGLHHGSVILGPVGSDRRLDVTVIGDTVNTAARIEALTRFYDVDILLTGNMLNAVGSNFYGVHRSIDMVKAKGKSETVEIFELLSV